MWGLWGSKATPSVYLQRRQARFPISGPDRVQQIYRVLAKTLPDRVRTLVEDRVIVLGQVGETRPDARTVAVGSGSVIEVTTGMMDFIYAVTRALVGMFVGHSQGAIEYSAALKLPQTQKLVAGVFTEWKAQQRWFGSSTPIRYSKFKISSIAHELAEQLSIQAEAFIVCHELAHAVMTHDQRDDNTESNADAQGLEFFLASVEGRGLRMPLAAVVLAIRIFAGLERFGVRFSEDYPPQEQRIRDLCDAFARHQSPQFVDEAMTIAVSLQELMDDVDDLIAGVSRGGHTSPYRQYIRLLAELEEVAKGNVSHDQFVADVDEVTATLGATAMQEVARRLLASYGPVPTPHAHLALSQRVRMAALLVELRPRLSAGARAAFEAAA